MSAEKNWQFELEFTRIRPLSKRAYGRQENLLAP